MTEPHSQFLGLRPTELRSIIARDYAALAEYSEVCRNPVEGVLVVPAEGNQNKWLGAIAVVGGMYDGGMFRFELTFSPQSSLSPQIVFWPPVFHPYIDPQNGGFDVSSMDPPWSDQFRVRDILNHIRSAFISVEPGGCRNPEAAALLRSDPVQYRNRVKMEIEQAHLDLANETSGSQLVFGQWIPELLQPKLDEMIDIGKKVVANRQIKEEERINLAQT